MVTSHANHNCLAAKLAIETGIRDLTHLQISLNLEIVI